MVWNIQNLMSLRKRVDIADTEVRQNQSDGNEAYERDHKFPALSLERRTINNL